MANQSRMKKTRPPKPAARKRATKPKSKPKAPARTTVRSEEQLVETMEELMAARGELSRLGHELTASHRELQERTLSSGSAEENLRGQMMALREELRVALAELEISRNEVERLKKKLAQYEAASASKKPVGSSPSV
jgi:hypothetical protein